MQHGIAGNIYGPAVGRNLGLLHEIKDQTGVLASVTKWQGTAATPAGVPGLVREAGHRQLADLKSPKLTERQRDHR